MALYTLAQAAKLGLDDLQTGLAETIITVSDFASMLPIVTVNGNAYVFNRESQLIDGQLIGADGTITDSTALEHSKVSLALQGISGQFDVLGIQMAQGIGANAGNDPQAVALQSAAKGIARKYEALALTGTVGANNFDGLDAAVTAFGAGQIVDVAGAALSFDHLDEAKSKVVSKGKQVDFLMGNAKVENKIKKLMRAAGGVTTIELNGKYFTSYDGVPFIRNDYMTDAQIYFGNWEEGGKEGVAMVVPTGNLFVADPGIVLEGKDATRFRLKMYASLAVHNTKGVARVEDFI
jgi:hypothetical protein